VIFFFVCLCTVSCVFAQTSNYERVPASQTGDGPGLVYTTAFSSKYNTTYYLATVSNPVSYFRVLAPTLANGSCGGYQNTSTRAAKEGCLFATNGGPFLTNQPPTAETCLGYVVSDSNIIQEQSTTNANFGLTKDNYFIIGVLNPQDVESMGYTQLLSGFGWLVRNGTAYTSTSTLIAPRTAIGTTTEGELLILEVDGEEDTAQGLNLTETATWFKQLGAYNAVNLDGGGSSVAYYNGKVVSYPTCHDTSEKCERAVTTITCVMPK